MIAIFILFLNLSWSKTIVGVIDTGIDPDHEAFKGRIEKITEDQSKGFDSIMDYTGHGTHVSGIITKNTPKDISIVPVKFIDNSIIEMEKTDPEASKFMKNFHYESLAKVAISKGAKIINISGGSYNYMESDYQFFKNNPEVLFVVASGNQLEGRKAYDLDVPKILWEAKKLKERVSYYPCGYDLPNIICVGSARVKVLTVVFSNYGSSIVDVWADGSHVESAIPYNNYAELSGSSMATPKITAQVAKIWNEHPDLKLSEVKKKLFEGLKYNEELKTKSKTGLYLP